MCSVHYQKDDLEVHIEVNISNNYKTLVVVVCIK